MPVLYLYLYLSKEVSSYHLYADRIFPLPSLTGVSQTGTKPQLDTSTQFVAIDGLLGLQNVKFETQQIEVCN